MSRRRTGTRYVPITISLKPSMIDDIEAELSPKQSRSQFIANAIQSKLDGGGESIAEMETKRLLAALLARDLSAHRKGYIRQWLTEPELRDTESC